jgi:predicted lipoprotein with Yx(FWY)xxD motif
MKTLLVLTAVAAAVLSSGAHATSTPTLVARSSSYGKILFDGRGFVLYAFTRDPRGGKSKCSGDCAARWPVYYKKGPLVAGKGVRQKLIGTVKRANGRRQVTYNRRPLYFYVGDRSPGQILCQDVFEFGGTWLVVRPNGTLVH